MDHAPTAADAVWRTFIAVDLPDALRVPLARLQQQIRRTGARVSCPDPAQIHLTLLFLGATFAAQLPAIIRWMDDAVAGLRSFTVEAAGVGAFGRPGLPRVIWAGVSGPPELDELHRRLAAAARTAGFPVEERPFHPHLTLARVKSGRHGAALTSWVASLLYSSYGTFDVDRICLYRSHLEQPRPMYTVLHTASLKGT